MIQLVTGQTATSKLFQRITASYPEVEPKCPNFKFPGQGQRPTPVAHLSTLIEIAWLCPGRHAKEFRRTLRLCDVHVERLKETHVAQKGIPVTMAVSQLSHAQILGKIRYDPLTKKGSVLDVIQLATATSSNHARMTWSSISTGFQEVANKIGHFKFPGQGQRPTPVAHLSTLIEIAWLCPGKHAKEFRRTGAVTLCRALGGDLSLVEEVKKRHGEVSEEEREAFLEGTGFEGAQAVVPADVHVRRYEAETARLEAEVAERRMQMLKRAAEVMRDEAAREKDDERHRLYMEDSSKNAMALYASMATGKRLAIEGPGIAGGRPENEPITISEVAADAGLRLDRGDLVRAGKAVAAAYRLANAGAVPAKHKQFVDGATRAVNTYFAKDRALIERALRDTFES